MSRYVKFVFKDVKSLKPVIRSTSDSGALDNVFELLPFEN